MDGRDRHGHERPTLRGSVGQEPGPAAPDGRQNLPDTGQSSTRLDSASKLASDNQVQSERERPLATTVFVGTAMRKLRTRRLVLEPLQESHAAALFESLRHPALYEFISQRPPESVAALREHYRRLARGASPDGRQSWLNWAIFSPSEGRYVGLVQATAYRDQSADVAYVIIRDVWGHGYAREAVSALIEHLREDWGTELVRATVDTSNLRSIGLLESLAFQRGAVRKDAELIHGILSDEVEYSLRLSQERGAHAATRRAIRRRPA